MITVVPPTTPPRNVPGCSEVTACMFTFLASRMMNTTVSTANA